MKKLQKKTKLGFGLYWRGGVIWMRSQREGAAFNESTHTTDPVLAAERLRARLAVAFAAKQMARAAEPVTMDELFVLDYARSQIEGPNSGTLSGMAYGYRNLGRLIPKAEVGRPTFPRLLAYVEARRAEGVGNNTIRKELILYRCSLALAKGAGRDVVLIDRLPKLPLHETKPGQRGTERTVGQLRAWLSDLQPESRAAAILILLTGIRHEEAHRLQPAHLVLEPGAHGSVGYLALPGPICKTKVPRRVCLTALGLIAFRMAVPIDRSHRSAYRGASERQDITPYIHDRDLRHAFASMSSALGDPYAVHLAMGHGRTVASGYQKQDMERLAALTQHVETKLGLTHRWLTHVHLCRWQYARGRQRLATSEGGVASL